MSEEKKPRENAAERMQRIQENAALRIKGIVDGAKPPAKHQPPPKEKPKGK